MIQKRHTVLPFAIPAVLATLALFVLGGPASGIAALAAMLSFIGALIHVLRGGDQDAVARANRSAVQGWIGGWF